MGLFDKKKKANKQSTNQDSGFSIDIGDMSNQPEPYDTFQSQDTSVNLDEDVLSDTSNNESNLGRVKNKKSKISKPKKIKKTKKKTIKPVNGKKSPLKLIVSIIVVIVILSVVAIAVLKFLPSQIDGSSISGGIDTNEPTIEEPTLEEPTLEEPTLEEPTLEEPTLEEPTVDQPADIEQPPVEANEQDVTTQSSGSVSIDEPVTQIITQVKDDEIEVAAEKPEDKLEEGAKSAESTDSADNVPVNIQIGVKDKDGKKSRKMTYQRFLKETEKTIYRED